MTTTRRINPINSVLSSRGIRAALLAMALLAMVLLGMAVGLTPAEAQEAAGEQEPQFLVSNLGVGLAGSGGIQNTLSAGRPGFAQAFTTGAEAGGYALGSLGIQVSHFYDASTVGDHLRVTINGVASGGGPGDALCTLTNPWSFSTPGVSAFAAPPGAGACPQLAKETTYFVVIEWVNPSGTGAFALIPQTYPTKGSAAGEEDPGGAEGWSIADRSHYLSVSSDARTWTAFAYTASIDAASFKIVVKEASGAPTIYGRARVGETLTANVLGIAAEDGLSQPVFAYQWARSDGATDTDIQDATGSTYTLVEADEGKTITVRVSFTDDAGNRQTLSSDATAPVVKSNTRAMGQPTIDGIAQVGETLTASTSAIADEDGLSQAVFAYQWARSDGGSDTDIQDATGSAHTLVEADEGRTITVTVSFTDDAGNPESLPSEPTGEVAAKPNSDATGAPLIDGTARVGETLTANTTGIADEDGLSQAVFAYQWATSDGATDTDIQDATGSAYTLVEVDEGNTVTVRVSFTDDAGSPESLTSESTARVAPDRPPGEPSFSTEEVTDRGIELSWNQDGGPGVEHYVVYRRMLPHEKLSAYATVPWSGEHRTSFTDADVHPGLEYLYQVAGVNSAGEGPKSVGAQLTVPGELLEAPTELAAVYTQHGMALKWGAPTNARTTDYWVYRGKFPKDGGADDGEVSKYVKIRADGSPMTFLDTGVDEGERYRYLIRAVNTLGEGSFTRSLEIDANGSEALVDTAATGAPAITGTAEVGQTLAVDTSPIADADGLNNPRFTYQWIRNDGAAAADIDGATGSTYTLVADDEGKTIKVTVSFTDDWSHTDTRTSDPTGEVGTDTSGEPDTVLLGTVEDGGTLILEDPDNDIYGIRLEHDPDGDIDKVALVLSYSEHGDDGDDDPQGGNLPAGSYDLKATAYKKDGEVLGTFKISFTVAAGTPAGDISPENNAPTGAPTISGTAQVGETLSAHTSAIADEDGLTNVVFSSQWMADDTNIQDATDATYTLTEDDVGKAITVRVSFTDDSNNEESLTSEPTGPVVPDPGPLTVFTVVDTSGDTDTVLGTLEDGGTLTLEDPASGSYGIRVDTDSGHDDHGDIHKVELDLTGAKTEGKTEGVYPYSLYGDEGEGNLTGENLPAGAYELKATAYDDDGDALGTLKVSFTVTAGQPAQQPAVVPNTSATGVPTISGTVQVGETLTADTSGIADADGLDNVVFSYQWLADDTDIQDATGSSYTLVSDDEGKAITVTVNFTDAEGNPETLTSDPTGEVAAKPNTSATGAPTISGTAQVGETLTASTSGIVDADGLTQAEFSYQWRADGVAIAGATGSGYTLTQAEQGKTVTVRVSFTDDAGHQETRTSVATGAVAAAANNQATGAPTISGAARVGETLTASTAGIVDADGLDNVTFSYQWRADDVDIAGATGSGYTLVSNDEGKTVTVTVSFTDAEGNPETLTSDPTGEVEAKPNTSATGVPTISGTVQVGETLTADVTGIADEDGLDNVTFSYQWRADDTNIQDATGSGYTLAAEDEGRTIKVTVSFTDAEGNPETRTSDPTGEVAAKPNIQATGLPTISGTIQVGQTLTADVTGIADEDGLTNPGFTYQWARNDGATDTDIQGATGSSYTLVSDDEGKTITVTVSFTDAEGNPETRTSDPTGEVKAKPNTSATGVPSISGTVRIGETLTADVTGIADEDGLTNVVFSYQWMADDTNIQGATDATYTLAEDDEGKAIKVLVSFADEAGNMESRPSAPTDAVAAPPAQNSSANGQPSISGTAQVGQTLTADTSGIADADGLDNVTFSYQWMADDTNIQDATGSSYTLVSDDEGKTITVTVSFTDAEGHQESRTSDPTGEVAAKPNIQATGAPSISGTARVGQTLTADTSGIDDEDDLTNAVFSYQWIRNDGNADEDIAGATGSSYTLVSDDEGKTITVTVSFTDAEGNPETLTSDPTGEVAAAPAQNTQATGVPTISGTVRVGETLTADTTGIADEDGLDNVTFSYQWMADDEDIAGATGSSYTLTEDDAGKAITVTVSFTDAEGNPETLTSDPTGEVAAAPAQNIQATGLPTISGTLQVGETLTADTTGIADEDGLNQVVFSYQWLADDVAIQDATGSSYTLTEDDEGTAITVTVSFTDAEGNPETLTSDPTGEVESQAGPLTGFTVVDAADTDQAVLWKHQTDGSKPEEGDTWKGWTDGGTLALGDPENGRYGIRADTESGEGIHRVALELTLESTGEKKVERTDDAAPYSLYGDEGEDALHGESLPVGSYTLKATAYTEDGETLGSLEISFTVALAPPGKPQDLEGEATAQEIKLTWKVPTGSVVTGYVVYRGTLRNGSMNGQALSKHATIDAAGKAMTYTDDNVEEGVEYRYRVAAVNSSGEGKKSTWLDITAE